MRSPLGAASLCFASALSLTGCIIANGQGGGPDMAELVGPTRDLSYTPRDLASAGLSVSGLSPARGSTAGGDTVLITGQGFQKGATVTVAGLAPRQTTFLSQAQLSILTPAVASPPNTSSVPPNLPSATLGLVPVVIQNPDGTKVTYQGYRYVATALVFDPPTLIPPAAQGMIGNGLNAGLFTDINGDGQRDLVLSLSGDNALVVLTSTNMGLGALQFASTDKGPAGLTSADLDGDGKADVAVAQSGAGTVRVLLGDGTGALPAAGQSTLTTAAQPQAVLAADVNGDKKPDLVVLSGSGSKVEVFINGSSPGAASFTSKGGQALSGSGVALAVGDVNGDGRADAVAASADGKVVVLLAQADGSLGAPQAVSGVSAATAVALGDMNGDGKLDLVAVSGDGSVYVALGSGSGIFSSSGTYMAGMSPSCVALANLDGDGLLDVAVGNSGGGDVSVLHNKGGGALESKALSQYQGPLSTDGGVMQKLTPVTTLPAGQGVRQVLAGPYLGDHEVDLVTINATDGNVGVIRNLSQ